MANNCLVTKLKGEVLNNNLSPLGGALISMSAGGNGSLRFVGDDVILVNKRTGEKTNVQERQSVLCSDLTEDTEYYAVSKYKALPDAGSTNAFNGITLNIEDWEFFENMDSVYRIDFRFGNVRGNLDKLQGSETVSSIDCLGCQVGFNLGTLLDKYPNIGNEGGTLNLYNTSGDIIGNVSDIGKLKYIPYEVYLPEAITGNIYDAIINLRTNIGETGTIPRFLVGSGCHLWSVYPGNNSFSISWTATTSSITVDGVTTTFDNSGNII